MKPLTLIIYSISVRYGSVRLCNIAYEFMPKKQRYKGNKQRSLIDS